MDETEGLPLQESPTSNYNTSTNSILVNKLLNNKSTSLHDSPVLNGRHTDDNDDEDLLHHTNHISSHDLTELLIRDPKLRKSQVNFRPAPLRRSVGGGSGSSNNNSRQRRGAQNSFPTGLDLNAMSVASLYDREGETTKKMDTQNDFVSELDENQYLKSLLMDNETFVDINKLNIENSDENDNSTPKSQKNDNYVNHDDNDDYIRRNGKDIDEDDGAPKNPFDTDLSQSLYFDDGVRSIDFVLVWQKCDTNESIELKRQEKRDVFLDNLLNEGLELELATKDDNNFVKVHAPLEVLRRYSEILKLRMPMKESLCRIKEAELAGNKRHSKLINAAQKIPGMQKIQKGSESILEQFRGLAKKIVEKVLVDEKHFPSKSHRFTAVYSRDKEYLFDIKQTSFFTSTVRSRIVQFILERKRFSLKKDEEYAFGIDRLITEEVYIAAYPLHDGEIYTPGSTRATLYNEWASVRRWYRYQPLDYIKEYFGVKIGLYFAWLGFYTNMLLLASVVGVGCFIYSWLTIDTNRPSLDICENGKNIKMCPLCDHWCDYWDLSDTCFHAKITYLFDNPTTVFFAVFMSFWATLFLEMWKRYSAEITHRWDLTGFDVHEEHPRPEYLARLSKIQRKKQNVITNQMEPDVPFWRMKLPATIFSFSVVILLVLLAMVAVLGVVLYRISILAALTAYGKEVTTSQALIFTTATAATINLCLIVVFNWVYTYLAEYLTEFELLRTQTEFDDSLTLKIYLLQFVNYYASIFYIAFFKGKFIGYPGNYEKFFNFRQEECGLGGCLMELSIQLAIIMIGKQALNTIIENVQPIFERWYMSYRVRRGKERDASFSKTVERWIRDLKLIPWGPRSLFPEYLEMVLQYGFVTIFVAAFPLAPFFALINNIFEMRFDAKKLLTHHRRPVGQRVRDIGVWYRILDSISKLSVITNGFIIAFTSDFIPRAVYRATLSPDGSLDGYLESTLAYFNTSDFQLGSAPVNDNMSVPLCRYPDYREPPWAGEKKYERTAMFWHILAARLAFVVCFENFVAFVMIIVRWVIPDMSRELRDQIRREAYVTNEIIIKQEASRAVGLRRSMSMREPRATLARMETLMNPTLSGSELDLVMHGPDDPTAPGHCRPDKYRENSQSFLDVETGRRILTPDSDEKIDPCSL